MASILKGTVRSYSAGAGTAEVEIVGSHGHWMTVPVATDLDSKTVVAGKRCVILSFDDRDQSDGVLVATYDDVYLMGSAPLDDHDHTGDTGDGGQLEADLALLATGDAATKVLTPDGANAVQWADVPVHASRHQNAGADEISVASLSGLLADGQTPVDHDHTGDAGDGGQLEADEVLVATSITDGHVLTADGANGVAWEAAAAGGGSEDHLLYQDQKTSGTDGGSSTSGSFQTRVLNTEVYDTGGDGSLSSNQVTLAAGTYRFVLSAPCYDSGYHKAILYNVTDAITIVGTSERSPSANVVTRSFVRGRFTIAGSKAFEIRHQCSSSNSGNGWGEATGFEIEVYSQLYLAKEAA